MGIAIVTPARKVLETLNRKELKDMRLKLEEYVDSTTPVTN